MDSGIRILHASSERHSKAEGLGFFEARAGQSKKGGLDEKLSCDECRNGISRKAKRSWRPSRPKRKGLPGFDGDPPKIDLRAELAQGFVNGIVLAHGDACAQDDDVRLAEGSNRIGQGQWIVGSVCRADKMGDFDELSREHGAVRIVEFARRRAHCRGTKLVSRSNNGDVGMAMNRQIANAGGREAGRCEPV